MSAASLFQSAGIDPASSAASPAEGLTPEQLREAFGLFTEATAKFSQTYEALQARVRELDLQLSETNSQLQKNLAEKERVKDYLAAILAGLPVGVAVVDEQGVVKTVNPAAQALLALDESACVGRPVSELF